MVQSYIQLNYDDATSTSGRRLYLNINSINRTKGVTTTDLPIPSKAAAQRQLLPLSGQINDFEISISLINEDSSVGFQVINLSNDLVGAGILNIKDQYNFLYDEVLRPGITAKYTLYIEWIDKTFTGYVNVEGSVLRDNFENEIELTLTFKEGTNFLATS